MSGTLWLTREEAAAYVKAKNLDAFDYWIRVNGIRAEGRCGRLPRYTREQLDRQLRFEATRKASRGAHLRKVSA